MSAHAWVSNVQSDVELILMFNADIVKEGGDVSADYLTDLRFGRPVPPEGCPKEVWADREYSQVKDGATLPPVFIANGYIVVGEEAADILRRYDVGQGALYPVRVLQRDRQTSFPGTWFCWVFGNVKDTLNSERSVNLRRFSPVPASRRQKLATDPQDDDVALSGEALNGPDIWLEERLIKPVCLSGPLGDALKAAGLAKTFRMTRARVV